MTSCSLISDIITCPVAWETTGFPLGAYCMKMHHVLLPGKPLGNMLGYMYSS